MPKREIIFSLDVEASGPIPGPNWMCSFGLCRTDDTDVAFARELKPLDLPGLAQADLPAAMEVVSQGLPDMLWSQLGDTPEARCQAVRAHFERQGTSPVEALLDLKSWLSGVCGRDRPVILGAPATFDFMWLYWYWWFLLEEMPPFGFSGLDLRSYFMGFHGVGFLGTGKRRYLKHYPNDLPHTHDPLDDARQQAQIWHDMTEARGRARIERG